MWVEIATIQLKFHSKSYCQRAEEEEEKQNSIKELMRQNTMTRRMPPIHRSPNEIESDWCTLINQ
jgi:hypothetical protein